MTVETIPEFRDMKPQLIELLDELEQIGGMPTEQLKFVRYSMTGPYVLVYLDERGVHESRLLPGLMAIAERLGAQLEACLPYRTDTMPSGQCVTVSLRTTVEQMPVVMKVVVDGDLYATLEAQHAATAVAA